VKHSSGGYESCPPQATAARAAPPPPTWVASASALAEIDQHDERAEELDIEAVLDFAERVSLNAPRLWLEANLEQRQRFQSFLFPEGLQVAEGEVRTPVTASFYEELRHFTTSKERLVDQLRMGWNSLLGWLREAQAWSLAAEVGE
jgi:hypothetical protein